MAMVSVYCSPVGAVREDAPVHRADLDICVEKGLDVDGVRGKEPFAQRALRRVLYMQASRPN